MTIDQWSQLTPSHQADLWPTLNESDRTAILASFPDTLRSIAAETVKTLDMSSRSAAATSKASRDAKGTHIAAALCYVAAAFSLLGATAFAILGNITALAGCASAALIWWIIGLIAAKILATGNRG